MSVKKPIRYLKHNYYLSMKVTLNKFVFRTNFKFSESRAVRKSDQVTEVSTCPVCMCLFVPSLTDTMPQD